MTHSLATAYRVHELCEVFEVSRSGYYAWRNGGRAKRAKANAELTDQIRTVHRESRATYGSPRVTKDLQVRGIRCGHNRVARIMAQAGLRGMQKARFRPRTTDSRHECPISPNRLGDGVLVSEPNRVWVTDITYIATREGWAYMSAFMDLSTRTIKGWVLRDSLKSRLVVDAFLQAVWRYKPSAGLIVHSDRGSQYAAEEFRRHLSAYEALGSMSRTGNCYDNATMESFWATLKTELQLDHPFETKEEARLAIFDYIETFYNRRRLHSSIGYKSPLEFEAQLMAKITYPQVSANSG
jgi:transposase InsO family protein